MLNVPLKTVRENETDRRAETFSQISQHYSQPVRKLFPKARANVEEISRHMVTYIPARGWENLMMSQRVLIESTEGR